MSKHHNHLSTRFLDWFLGLAVLLQSGYSFAVNESSQVFSLDGRMMSTTQANTPILDPNVTVTLQILDYSQTCILYEERQTINSQASNGYFDVDLGSPLGGGPLLKRTNNDSNHTMAQIFSNNQLMTLSGKSLSNGTACNYTPSSGDSRFVRMTMVLSTDGSTKVFSPNVEINSVPSALVAESLQGYDPTQFLFIGIPSVPDLTQAKVENIFSPTNYPRLNTLLSVAPTNYVQSNGSGSVGLGTTTPQTRLDIAGSIRVGNGGETCDASHTGGIRYNAGNIEFCNGTSWTVLAASGGGSVVSVSSVNSDISVTNGSSNASLTLNSGATGGAGDANKIAKLDAGGLLPIAMIPSLPSSKITTGTLSIAQGGTNSSAALVNNRVMASVGGAIVETSVTTTELGYISGGSSSFQSQINTKAASGGYTNYSVMGVNGSGAMTAIPGTTNNTILQWSVTGPIWSSATYPSSTTANQLLYSSSNNVVGGLATAANGVLITSGVNVPSISSTLPTAVQSNITQLGTIGSPIINNTNSASTALALTQSGSGYAATFMGGNVGVGSSTPTSLFQTADVSAKTTAYTGILHSVTNTSSTAAINKIGMDIQSTGVWNGAGAINTGLAVNATGGATNYAATFSGGNVGIGTLTPAAPLDVAGDVKVGNSSASCTASNKGSIRYNNVSSVLEFCNGTGWNLIQAAACTNATPGVFSFIDQANVALSTLTTSNIVQVTGINCAVPVTISGSGSPQYRICSDAACATPVQGWTSSPSSITVGQYVQTQLTSDSAGGSPFKATIIIGSGASVWTVTTVGDCSGSPQIGTVCTDGTVYAGLTPDGNVPMYTTRCDYGQTWNGTSCTGSRTALTWNNGSSNWTVTGVSSVTTGSLSTSTLYANVDAGSAYSAAVACYTLNANSHSTGWYLPAKAELNVLYGNNGVIKNFDVSGSYYWSSTEYANSYAWSQRFSDGSQSFNGKNNTYWVRCVRK
jgi:hypothetical protein